MRVALFFLIAGVICVGGLLFYLAQLQGTTNDQANSQNTNTQQATARWVTYGTDIPGGWHFTLRHPVKVSASAVDSTIYEFKYIGPNSQAQTEITDGYFIAIIFSTSTDLEQYARAQQPNSRIQTLSFNGRPALTYTTTSAVGDGMSSHIIYTLSDDSNEIIDMAYRTFGQRSRTYQDTVFTILKTARVVPIGNGLSGSHTPLQIAMLDYEGIGEESDGPTRGCDRIVFVQANVPATTTPLNAALHTLFDYTDETVDGWHNFIAKTNNTLTFNHATLNNGVASVYLDGSLSGLVGVCDNPRARIQIEETALQFDSVDSVDIYLNGTRTDLQPSGRG